MPQAEIIATTVGDLAETVSITHKFDKPELVFLNTSDIERGQFLHRDYSPIKGWPGQAKKSIKKGDILFSEIRPANGRFAFVDFDAADYVVSTKLMVIRPKEGKVVPRFLYHYLTSSTVTGWLQHLAESRSGTFPQITFDQVSELELPLFSLAEQQAIAELFDSLDDKIEQNRRTGRKLEALARAVFKAWFVDFEPVKAKATGAAGFPGMPAVAFAALPDRLVSSDIGPVPAGWPVATLRDLATFITGGTPSKSDPANWGGDFPWVSAKDMHVRIVSDSESHLTDAGRMLVRRCAPRHSTLMVIRGMSLMNEVRIGWCTREVAFNQDLRAFIARDGVPPEFLFLWLGSSEAKLMQMVDTASHGTGRILTDRLGGMSIARPVDTVMRAFVDVAGPSMAFRESIHFESEKLAAHRDYLLPRLLSGRLRVVEAARMAGECV